MITQFAITQALEALHYKRNRIEELRQKLPKDLQAEIESLTASLQLTCKAIAEIENSLARAPKNDEMRDRHIEQTPPEKEMSKMKTDSATPESADGAGSSPSSCSAPVLFPRNPERDENGRAVLYPGLPRFEGVCGLFTTDEGEVAIIAPTFEALDAHVRKMGVSAEVSRDACILATWDRVPNKAAA